MFQMIKLFHVVGAVGTDTLNAHFKNTVFGLGLVDGDYPFSRSFFFSVTDLP